MPTPFFEEPLPTGVFFTITLDPDRELGTHPRIQGPEDLSIPSLEGCVALQELKYN